MLKRNLAHFSFELIQGRVNDLRSSVTLFHMFAEVYLAEGIKTISGFVNIWEKKK